MTIRDASDALAAVQAERKQISMQLSANLLGLQKRDEALQSVIVATRDLHDKELALTNEERGLNVGIREKDLGFYVFLNYFSRRGEFFK